MAIIKLYDKTMSYLNKKKCSLKIKVILVSLTLFFITGCEKYNLKKVQVSNPKKIGFIEDVNENISFSQNREEIILARSEGFSLLNWKTKKRFEVFDSKNIFTQIKLFRTKPYFSIYRTQGKGKLWNLKTRNLIFSWDNKENKSSVEIDISKSGKYFFTGNQLIDLANGKILVDKKGYTNAGVISSNEKILASVFTYLSVIHLNSIPDGKLLARWKVNKIHFPFYSPSIWKPGISKNAKYFFITTGGNLNIYDISDPKNPFETESFSDVSHYKYLENLNALLIFSEENKGVRLISLEDNFKTVWSYSFDDRIRETSSLGGKKILIFSFDRKKVFGIDLITGKPLFQFLASAKFHNIDISYDNQLIALNTKKGVYIYKTPNFSEVKKNQER